MSKRITAIQEEAKKNHARREAILAAADKEGRDLTEEETTEYDALDERAGVLSTSEKRELKLIDDKKSIGTIPAEPDPFTEPARVKKHDPSYGFRDVREQITAVMEAGNGRVDPRLVPLAAAGSDEQGVYADPYGGFLLAEAFMPDVKGLGAEADFTAGRTTDIPMTAAVVSFPARVDKNHSTSVSGGLTVGRRLETASPTSSRMELEKVKLEATGLFGLSYVTEELIQRSPVSIAAMLDQGFRDQFSYHGVSEKLTGTGVGEPEGIATSPALVSVAKEAGQAADTIVGDNLVKMRSRVWRYDQAIWIANHDCYPQLAEAHLSGTNSDTQLYQHSLVDDRPDTLLGRPIFYTEYCETLGDKGDIYCTVWSEYLVGTLTGGPQQAESVHVRFLNHERTFKFWIENDGKCWWRTALTPKNSTATLSPFVTLDARA